MTASTSIFATVRVTSFSPRPGYGPFYSVGLVNGTKPILRTSRSPFANFEDALEPGALDGCSFDGSTLAFWDLRNVTLGTAGNLERPLRIAKDGRGLPEFEFSSVKSPAIDAFRALCRKYRFGVAEIRVEVRDGGERITRRAGKPLLRTICRGGVAWLDSITLQAGPGNSGLPVEVRSISQFLASEPTVANHQTKRQTAGDRLSVANQNSSRITDHERQHPTAAGSH